MSETTTDTESAPAAYAILPIGTVVDGRYRIESHIAQGGMGMIYRARHLLMQREVALKVLLTTQHAGVTPEEIRARFLREAQIAALVTHQNIVTMYDFGFCGVHKQPYIAMQLLDGVDLESRLDGHGGIAPSRVLRLIKPVLAGLQKAHAMNIIHKDLKPANLFLHDEGKPGEQLIILDFGVSRFAEAQNGGLTQAGQFAGTPAYLGPEYIQQQIARPALDVYAMGLVLVEMLTGAPVVSGETILQVLIAQVNQTFVLPTELLGSPLGPVIKRALSANWQQRYANAGAFLAALEEVTADYLRWDGSELPEQTTRRVAHSTPPRASRRPVHRMATPVVWQKSVPAPAAVTPPAQGRATPPPARAKVPTSPPARAKVPTPPPIRATAPAPASPRAKAPTPASPRAKVPPPPPPVRVTSPAPVAARTKAPMPASARAKASTPASARATALTPAAARTKAPTPPPPEAPVLLPPRPVVSAPAPSPAAPPVDSFDSLFHKANVAYIRRDFTAGLDLFNRCALLRPNDARVQHNIAIITKRLEKGRR